MGWLCVVRMTYRRAVAMTTDASICLYVKNEVAWSFILTVRSDNAYFCDRGDLLEQLAKLKNPKLRRQFQTFFYIPAYLISDVAADVIRLRYHFDETKKKCKTLPCRAPIVSTTCQPRYSQRAAQRSRKMKMNGPVEI